MKKCQECGALFRGKVSFCPKCGMPTDEMLKKEREEILNATVEDIRALAPITKAVLETGAVCVVGNEDKIKADRELFKEIKPLFE